MVPKKAWLGEETTAVNPTEEPEGVLVRMKEPWGFPFIIRGSAITGVNVNQQDKPYSC